MENNQNLEQQLSQYRYIKEQKDMFQGQFEIINASLGNLYTTKLTLDNLKEGVNDDDEILVPIGGLVSIKATLKDTKKVLVYVKNDTVIEILKPIKSNLVFESSKARFINNCLKLGTEGIAGFPILKGQGPAIECAEALPCYTHDRGPCCILDLRYSFRRTYGRGRSKPRCGRPRSCNSPGDGILNRG